MVLALALALNLLTFFLLDAAQELKDFLLKCFTRDVNLRPGPDELMKHPWICKNVQPVRPDLCL